MIEFVPEKEIQSKAESRQPMSTPFRANEDLCWPVARHDGLNVLWALFPGKLTVTETAPQRAADERMWNPRKPCV